MAYVDAFVWPTRQARRRGALTLMALAAIAAIVPCGGCTRRGISGTPPAASVLLVTIDTLRADHVGAYGYREAATPTLDGLARRGVRFDRAFAPAPITLTSHASLLTGRYPPGHGARHNGMRMDERVPTLATVLKQRGFATAAFVAAFPLDRRFGLASGFDVYSDQMPRGRDGRPANERPGAVVVDEALAWLGRHRQQRFFVWVHLFEPHAPYGDARAAAHLTPIQRYDQEIATADAQIGRLLAGLGTMADDTLIVLASDHGEAFGEHGEIAHSIFVYDTTLRVLLLIAGAGVPNRGASVADPVSLVDIPATVMRLLGFSPFDTDGISLHEALAGRPLPARDLYAESLAPLLDFGWSPLRSLRSGGWKLIAAPRPELYAIDSDTTESRDLARAEPERLRGLSARLDRFAPPDLPGAPGLQTETTDLQAVSRLRALGYLSGSSGSAGFGRADPKDRRDLAARIAAVTSGELEGAELQSALEAIIREDPGNGQAHLRLGYVLLDSGQPRQAAPHFEAAIRAGVPTADPHLGLAACQVARGELRAAMETLAQADRVEPGNPVVLANIGLLQEKAGRPDAAVRSLEAALAIDPQLHEARFNLALVYARAGHRDKAAQTAADLLRRLPSDAPQRPEVERLLRALK